MVKHGQTITSLEGADAARGTCRPKTEGEEVHRDIHLNTDVCNSEPSRFVYWWMGEMVAACCYPTNDTAIFRLNDICGTLSRGHGCFGSHKWMRTAHALVSREHGHTCTVVRVFMRCMELSHDVEML